MEIEIIEKKAFKVFGKENVGKVVFDEQWLHDVFKEIFVKFEQIVGMAKREKNGNLAGFWGIPTKLEKDLCIEGNDGTFIAGCEVYDSAVAPNNWFELKMPSQRYAVIKVTPLNYIQCYQIAWEKYFNKGEYNVQGPVQLKYEASDMDGSFYLYFPIE